MAFNPEFPLFINQAVVDNATRREQEAQAALRRAKQQEENKRKSANGNYQKCLDRTYLVTHFKWTHSAVENTLDRRLRGEKVSVHFAADRPHMTHCCLMGRE